MHHRTRLLLAALVALATLSLAPGAFAAVKLRALHAIPDVGPVTVYVNGQAAVPSLGTLQSSPYLEVPAGNYRVQVAPQGQPASAAVLTADVTLRDGQRYTAFASGQLARGTAALGLREDQLRAAFASSQIRVWHLSPDAPAVDVFVNGNKAVSNLAFRSATSYLTLPPGTYDVRINVANSSTVVLSQQVTLARGEAYTAVALGSAATPPAGAGFTVDALRDATSGALVRALHAIPNAPAVTVYVNGKAVAASLGTLAATPYLTLDPGRYTVAIALRGRPASAAVLRGVFTIADKTRTTIVARGLVGTTSAALAAQPDIAVAPAGKSALRLWHLSPNAPRVDGYLNGKKVLSKVPFKAASQYFTLNPGKHTVKLTVAGRPQAVVFNRTLTFQRDSAVTAAALGVIKTQGRPVGVPFRVKAFSDYAQLRVD
jgi:hypothetical protein